MKEDIIRMAQEAQFEGFGNGDWVCTTEEIERFAAIVEDAQAKRMHADGMVTIGHMRRQIAAERNKLVVWMMAQGYTYDIERDKLNEWMGYTASQGDATKDLLTELGWQIEQRIKGLMSDMECQVAERVKAERERFYGQDKPAECAKGCPPKQICDYCQVVAPVRAMILAEREACAKVFEGKVGQADLRDIATAIRARGQT
jgi:hypothetical protein